MRLKNRDNYNLKQVDSSKERSSLVTCILLFISAAAFCCLAIQASGNLTRLPLFIIAAGVLIFLQRKKLDLGYLRINDKEDAAYTVAGMVVLFVMALLFVKLCLDNNNLAGVESVLNIEHETMKYVTVALAAVAAVVAVPAVVYVLKWTFRGWLDVRHSVFARYSYLKKAFIIMAVIFCVSIITIIRADYIYKDDMGRLLGGVTVYSRESRFFAEFTSMLLHMDKFYADVSPITQILEMVIMAAACVIVYATINSDRKPGFFDIVAMMPFALTPYFLECVSFKYDPPQHALAVLFAVVPFLYLRQDRKKFLWLTAACMPLVCMCHQVPMAFYPSIVLLLCILEWNKGSKTIKEIAAFAGQSAAAYLAGMVVYRFGILNVLPRSDSFTSTKLWPIKELIPGTIQNYRAFLGAIKHDFSIIWLLLIAVLFVAFIAVLTITSGKKKLPALVVNGLTFVVLAAMAYSLYPVLAQAQYSPRHMYSFGLFLGLITVTAVSYSEKIRDRGVITKTAAILLAMCFFIFAISYGNSLQQQKNYTEYRVEMLLDTLTEITSEDPEGTYTVQVTGTTGYAPTVDALGQTGNMTKKLVTTSCNEYFSGWGANGLCGYYGLNITFRDVTKDPDFRDLDMKIYEKNHYHTISVRGHRILIELNDR